MVVVDFRVERYTNISSYRGMEFVTVVQYSTPSTLTNRIEFTILLL